MRLAVASCWAYRDCWKPFVEVLKQFWPDCPYRTVLITEMLEHPVSNLFHGAFVAGRDKNWCECVGSFAAQSKEPILLLQEDFWLSAPVQQHLIERAESLVNQGAACVRLYPCPGADQPSADPYFGEVSRDADYRISCQAAIWRPDYLANIASHCEGGTAASFELEGTPFSRTLSDPVLAYNREMPPWPLEYICTSVVRGKWNPDAKILCDKYGIDVDWSLRPFVS